MKKLLAVLSVAALLSPALAFAAKDDVSMDTSVVLSVGGIEVDISGATAVIESITVDTSSFSFHLQPESSIEMTAPNGNMLSTDMSTNIVTSTCNSSGSVLKYIGTGDRIVKITPSTSLCSGSHSHSSSSSSSAASTKTATSAAPTVVSSSGLSSAQVQSILDVLASFSADAATIAKVKAALEGSAPTTGSVTSTAAAAFKSNLTTGSLGSEVKALQEFLNAHGYTVATSGAGSVGKETTTFGAATRAALVKYQNAKGITPAAGYFGTKTRAVINAEK
ncbi:MAG: peptidoglycan-binding domain-containing protein [Candidatus Kaiserbacteria bacterium]|nr:peptidoglycan-binding domain-containing protein [Candidatus Kaiserbacteria bacterium]